MQKVLRRFIMDDLKRLIYADPVYEELRKAYEGLKRISETLTYHEDIQVCNVQLATYKEAMQYIKDAPAVDAVEIPDCKMCEFNYTLNWHQCEGCFGNARNNFTPRMDGDSNG
jgi:hypothetical protein